MTADQFSTAYPNLYDQVTEGLITINYKVFAEAGYTISGSGVVGDVDKIVKIIEIDKVSVPVVNSGTTKEFTPTATSTTGLKYLYSTDPTATLDQFMSLSDLLAKKVNLYNNSTDMLNNLYFIPAINKNLSANYALDKTPTSIQVDINSLAKVIEHVKLPQLTSKTNATNDYSLEDSTTKHVSFTYSTSFQNSKQGDFGVIKAQFPNLFTGNVTAQFKYSFIADAGYQIDPSIIERAGNFDIYTAK